MLAREAARLVNRDAAHLMRASAVVPAPARSIGQGCIGKARRSAESGGAACAPIGARLDREHRSAAAPERIPPIVGQVLAGPGEPLRHAERGFMEARFGRDFSSVRVHSDAHAMRSAQAVNARAYTVGQHIVLGESATATNDTAGRHTLAHELAHTVQQRHLTASAPDSISAPGSAAEREADAAADRVMIGKPLAPMALRTSPTHALHRVPLPNTGTRSPGARTTTPARVATSVATAPQFPARGPNPADCMDTACSTATRAPAPANDQEAGARVDAWEQQALACVGAGGPASNASHETEIVANEQAEIRSAANVLRTVTLPGLGRGARRYQDFLASLGETCAGKARETRIEFHYNVVFDNPPTAASRWGSGAGSWDNVERALSALPASATWGNPRLIAFHRAACHPSDLDASGQCVGQGSGPVRSFTGGDTNSANATTSDIRVFDQGLGSAPYSRSAKLGITTTEQTIRHEVGHVIDMQIPRAEHERFFHDIVQWDEFSWAWVSSPSPRIATWQAERDRLRTLLGFDEARFDAWLRTLQPAVPVTVAGRTYTRDANGTGGSTLFLGAVDNTRRPQGVEFEYARTGQGEYMAEIYAFAVSRPQFLHDVLPADQIEWLKRVVFKTPATPHEWARELATRERGSSSSLLPRLMRVFTWEQIEQVFNDQPLAGGARRA